MASAARADRTQRTLQRSARRAGDPSARDAYRKPAASTRLPTPPRSTTAPAAAAVPRPVPNHRPRSRPPAPCRALELPHLLLRRLELLPVDAVVADQPRTRVARPPHQPHRKRRDRRGRLTPLISHRITARGSRSWRRWTDVPFVTGPVGTLLVAGRGDHVACGVLAGAAAAPPGSAAGRRRRHRPGGARGGGAGGAGARDGRAPEDGFEGDDWGPGVARPRPPVRL